MFLNSFKIFFKLQNQQFIFKNEFRKFLLLKLNNGLLILPLFHFPQRPPRLYRQNPEVGPLVVPAKVRRVKYYSH
jgi:hypothetical protein